MVSVVKIRVFVDGKPVGWLRRIGDETVLSASLARANKYQTASPSDSLDMATAMAEFEGPEAASIKASHPRVTFQLVRV